MKQPLAPEVKAQLEVRTNRLREKANMVSLLIHYGYQVQDWGGDREQQFRCDLHGSGRDDKPSARAYANGFYCWACGVSYDVIDLVRIKEGLNFSQACTFLEKMYTLPTLPWIDYQYEPLPAKENIADDVLKKEVSFEDWQKRLKALLTPLTHDRVLSRVPLLSFWESFDKVCYLVRREKLSENKGAVALNRLRANVIKAMQEENR